MQRRLTTQHAAATAAPGAAVQIGSAVQIIDGLIDDAIRMSASDIHIEPRKTGVEIRFRVDGVLHEVRMLRKEMQDACTARVKIMADLDINERRLPQDGRIPITNNGRSLDLRVSTMPVLYGEKVVMRVLDRSIGLRGLEDLDFSPANQARFEGLIRQPFGLIVLTGPTGAGKTTTLYAALHVLRSKTTNIMTCEDPVEYDLDGINQSAVFDKVGLTFARQLRAILRQDPDIILVGEMRDAETAEVAFRASMTGHLVLSTLHANDAATTVTRLLDMGVPPFLISPGLTGIVAQRLTRRLCVQCRRPGPPMPAQAVLLGLEEGEPIFHPVGCPACDGTGYRGRIAVQEVLACDEAFSRLIMSQPSGPQLRAAALASGMVSLREDALVKLRAGLTSADDVVRQVHVRLE